MTPLVWLALAGAVALGPVPSVAGRRAAGLARRGRLATLGVPAPRRWRPRVTAPAIAVLWCAGWTAAACALGRVALGAAGAVVAATLAWLFSSALGRRRDARGRQGLLAAVRLLVAELEAGSRPGAALGAAAVVATHHADTFTAAAAACATGTDVADVLMSSGASDLAPLAHAWRVGALTGAPMAQVLGRVAADLADHERQHGAVTVALAGPRSSGALLAGLPVVGIALGAAMGARPLAFLLGAPAGRLLCCVGVLLDAAGVVWTQRLMQRAQLA